MTHPLSGIAEATVNRSLRLDPEYSRILSPLAGKCIQFKAESGIGLTVMIAFHGDGVVFVPPGNGVADVELAGSVSALLGLLPGSPFGGSGEEITIRGDSSVLMEFKRALVRLRVDWREPAAELFGDTLGHSLTQGLEQFSRIVRCKATSLWLDTKDYLGEESELLESRDAVREFCTDVDRLRDDTARLEKRLQRLLARSVIGDSS